jgi:hypothetical protein
MLENTGDFKVSIQEHGPAFPVSDLSKTQCPGMDLRDYFAAQALPGLIAHGEALVTDRYNPQSTMADVVASHAYFIADAMLNARE